MNCKLSIVIPAFNEEKRLTSTLDAVAAYAARLGGGAETIVVDDGSADGTTALVRKYARAHAGVRLIENGRNRGKGYAVRRGVLEATGERILFTDADLSAPIEEVEKLLPWFEQGYDVVIGSRALAESRILVHQSAARETMGRIFNLLVQCLALRGIRDTQCGFKCFRRAPARDVFKRQTLTGFSFDVEVLHLASRLGYRIREVPVTWSNSADTRVNALWDSARMFLDLLRIRLRHRRLRPRSPASLRGR